MIRLLAIAPNQLLATLLVQVLDGEDDIDVVAAINDPAEVAPFAGDVNLIAVHASSLEREARRIIRELHEQVPDARIVILHAPNFDDVLVGLVEVGVSGFVRPDEGTSDMLATIRAVHEHGSHIDPGLTQALVRRIAELHDEVISRAPLTGSSEAELSEREWEVLGLIGKGLSNPRIAEILYISTGTVKNHVHNILTKLNVRDRSQASYWYAWRTHSPSRVTAGAGMSDTARLASGTRGSLMAAVHDPVVRKEMEAALTAFGKQLGWPIGHIHVFDPRSGVMIPSGVWYREDPNAFPAFQAATEASELALKPGIISRIMSNPEPAWVADVRDDPGFLRAGAAREAGIKSALFLPLVDETLFGAIEFFTTEKREPNPAIVADIIRSSAGIGQFLERPPGEPGPQPNGRRSNL